MKSTRTLPILKSCCVVIWSSSTDKDQAQNNQPENNNYFDGAQPELKFAEEFDAEVVDENDGNKEDGDESSGVDLCTWYPVLYDQGCGC
jgi:hypothetical protein